jgi:hypothetical protein
MAALPISPIQIFNRIFTTEGLKGTEGSDLK